MPNKQEWPDYFPPGVPPNEAKSAGGQAYRLVKNTPPSAEDFQSTYEEFPNRSFNEEAFPKAYGLSFYRALACILKTKKRYRALRSRKIVKGVLLPNHGKMLPTPSNGNSHLTLWKRSKARMHDDFTDEVN